MTKKYTLTTSEETVTENPEDIIRLMKLAGLSNAQAVAEEEVTEEARDWANTPGGTSEEQLELDPTDFEKKTGDAIAKQKKSIQPTLGDNPLEYSLDENEIQEALIKEFDKTEEVTEELTAGQKKLPPALQKSILAKQGKKDEAVEEKEETTVEENLEKAQEEIDELKEEELKEDCSCGHGSDCDCGPDCGCGCNAVSESEEEVSEDDYMLKRSDGEYDKDEVRKMQYQQNVSDPLNRDIEASEKAITIEVDYDLELDKKKNNPLLKRHHQLMKKFGVFISMPEWQEGPPDSGFGVWTAKVRGSKKNLLGWLKAWEYDYDKEQLDDMGLGEAAPHNEDQERIRKLINH